MGRKRRHNAKTGDGGAEIRARKKFVKQAERDQRDAERIDFYDDPSDDENKSHDDGSYPSPSEDEQELIGLGEDGDSEQSESENEEDTNDLDSDLDGEDFEDEKRKIREMDGKWGKSKKNFYSADTAEYELESDEEAARDEENAALELQKKEAALMDEDDFDFEEHADDVDSSDVRPTQSDDLVTEELAGIPLLGETAGQGSIEQLRKDFSKMSKKEKLEIVNQSSPELLGLVSELDNAMKELKEKVTPGLSKLKALSKRSHSFDGGLKYLTSKQNLLLNYISNISFYLLVKAEGKDMHEHPVLEHLLRLKKIIDKIEPTDSLVKEQLSTLLQSDLDIQSDSEEEDGMSQFLSSDKSKYRPKKNERKNVKEVPANPYIESDTISNAERADAEKFYAAALREKEKLKTNKKNFYSHDKVIYSSSEEEEEGKRGASYQIMKNRGLKAHKSKLNRNPRVKKRMQYRKAVIRRKGQVRDVRIGEAGYYGGETTGIKSNLTRSRKIRN